MVLIHYVSKLLRLIPNLILQFLYMSEGVMHFNVDLFVFSAKPFYKTALTFHGVWSAFHVQKFQLSR